MFFMTRFFLSRRAISKVLATIIIVVVIAAIAGAAWYMYMAAPKKPNKIVVATAAPLLYGLDYYLEQAKKDLGIEIELIEIPFAELYTKVVTDMSNPRGKFDLILVPNDWIGEFATKGLILPLDEYIEKYKDELKYDDILPHLRNRLMKWAGKTYAITFDGDCHLLYYRKDLLTDPKAREMFKREYGYDLPVPPRTWDELIDVAEFFYKHREEFGLKGGIAISAKRGSETPWFFIDIVASLIKPSEKYKMPIIYFDPDIGNPLVNTPPWIKAFEIYREIIKYGPEGILSFDVGDIRHSFTAGEVALAIDWGDIGPLSIAPESKVKGLVGFAPLPGSKVVYDLEKGEWIELDEPYRPAVLNFGGWMFMVPANTKNKGTTELAVKYAIYMSAPERANYLAIAKGETGVNIFRYSQFYDKNPDLWKSVGWDPESARNYCEVIRSIYENPSPVWDIRVPGFKKFWDDLDAAISYVLTDTKTPEEAASWLYEQWASNIEDIGRDKFIEYYREDLGLP